MKPLTRAALAAALACASSCAFSQANAGASARIDNFSYTLTDLDPDDGVGPELVWTQVVSKSAAATADQQPGTTPWPTYTETARGTNIELAGYGSSVTFGDAQASTYEGGTAVNLSAGATGASHSALALLGGYFTLSANTAVTFTADVSLVGIGTVEPGTPPLVDTDWSYFQVSAQAGIGSFVGATATDPGTVLARNEQGLPDLSKQVQFVLYPKDGAGDSRREDRQLSLDFRNATGATASFNVGVTTSASAYTVAAIPEPGTWALTGIGLSVAAWAARRRSAG